MRRPTWQHSLGPSEIHPLPPMPSQYESEISFICPRCRKFVATKLAVPELSFTGERASENVSEGSVEVACPSCETPFPGYCFNSMGDCQITLDDHPTVAIHAELAEYSYDEDWVTYEAPDNPLAILIDLYHHASDLLAEHGGGGAHLLNRMIFAQQIGGLEAYLADTLINLVKNDTDAMKRLIAGDSDLRSKKFTLAEISANAQLVEQEVLLYLRSILYHNMPKVRAIYKIAADVDIFELLEATKDRLRPLSIGTIACIATVETVKAIYSRCSQSLTFRRPRISYENSLNGWKRPYERAGISRPRYRDIEQGAAAARATTLINVARALGMELMLIPQAMVPGVNALLRPSEDEDQPAFTTGEDEE